jgi:hypothetical protein
VISLYDWPKLYSSLPETRTVTLEGRTVEVTMAENLWGWLDYFRKGQSIDDFVDGMNGLPSVQDNSGETILGVLAMQLVDAYRSQEWTTGPFAKEHQAQLEEALLHLPSVDWSQIAEDDPTAWWEQFLGANQNEMRLVEFEDAHLPIDLPARTWMVLDLARNGRHTAQAFGVYLETSDGDAERAARALRALAKGKFEQIKSAGSHPLVEADFHLGIDFATRFLDA